MAVSTKSSIFAARMKTINSHYIPMPEPRWLIVDPNGQIYEQLGTIAVVVEKGNNGIATHSYPVVANAIADVYNDSQEDGLATFCSLAPADGRTLDDVRLEDCFRLCPTNHRVLPYLKFNLMAMKFLSYAGFENFDLAQTIDNLYGCNIRLDFPKENEQTIQLTMSGCAGVVYLESDLGGLYFAIPLSSPVNGNQVEIDSDKILLEAVNQAKAYLKINPNYKFRFTTAIESLQDVIDEVNNNFGNYMDQEG